MWNGRPQKMVLGDGRPKGMKLVLQERGINTDHMKAVDMRLILGNHEDFKSQHDFKRNAKHDCHDVQ